ncbi:MAG: aminoacyl-tRNA hydrolase [Thermodesulfobacteriota bacterium]
MKIIFGLGNPGIRYRKTRHNIGFHIVDRLAEMYHIQISSKRFKSLYGKGWIEAEEVVLAKPMTYMNQSGEAVREALDFFHLSPEDLIIIHDDLDLPFGRLRFKRKGGDGGHQGVRSIIESLNKNNFLRLKIGIGRPPEGKEASEYVLSPFDEIEQSKLREVISKGAESIKVLLLDGIEKAMNKFQKKQ